MAAGRRRWLAARRRAPPLSARVRARGSVRQPARARHLLGGVEIDSRASFLGWSLVLTLAACSSVCVVGGAAYGTGVQGAPAGLKAHPHEERWAQLAGLVTNAISFAKSKASTRGDRELNSPLTAASAPVDGSSSGGHDEEVVE